MLLLVFPKAKCSTTDEQQISKKFLYLYLWLNLEVGHQLRLLHEKPGVGIVVGQHEETVELRVLNRVSLQKRVDELEHRGRILDLYRAVDAQVRYLEPHHRTSRRNGATKPRGGAAIFHPTPESRRYRRRRRHSLLQTTTTATDYKPSSSFFLLPTSSLTLTHSLTHTLSLYSVMIVVRRV